MELAGSAFQGRVRYWSVHVPLEREPDAALLHMLVPTERQEVQRLQRRGDRARYVCTRAALRQVLAREYGCSSTKEIARTAWGKPVLQDAMGLEFNVSHAGAWGMVAVTQAGQLGVDIEKTPRLALDGLAPYICTPAESARLVPCSPAAQRAELLRLWVGKEAALKAVGVGIAGGHMPLLSLRADGRVQAQAQLPFDAMQIRVEMLPFVDGYCAAVALYSTLHKDLSEDANTCDSNA